MRENKEIILMSLEETNNHIKVKPSFFKPLTFSDLFPKDKLYKLNMEAEPGEVIINGETLKETTTITIPIKFNYDISIYILVPGGWLPLLSIIKYKYLIPDRNFISSIIQNKSNKTNPNRKAIKWYLDLIKDSDIVISPFLYALEGDKKRKPTYNEFCNSFDKAVEELTSYFTRSKIIYPKDKNFYKGCYSLLEEITKNQIDEINFLMETAPLVATPHSDRQVKNIQDKIDMIAIKYNLLGKSFLYYLVISCLYERNDKKYFKAARKVLKPNLNYTEINAYNTIADINALNLFIHIKYILKMPYLICTCDKGLVAFWSGLNPIKISNKDKKNSIEFKINECLFPRLNLKQRENLAYSIKEKVRSNYDANRLY